MQSICEGDAWVLGGVISTSVGAAGMAILYAAERAARLEKQVEYWLTPRGAMSIGRQALGL